MKNVWQKVINICLYSLVFLMPLFWLPVTFEAFNFNKLYLLFGLVSVGLFAWIGKMIFKEILSDGSLNSKEDSEYSKEWNLNGENAIFGISR